jgi:hypothetical protein
MPLYYCLLPHGVISQTSLADSGRLLAFIPDSVRNDDLGLIEAGNSTLAAHFADAWRCAMTGQPDELVRNGLHFRQIDRFPILYRPYGPLLDPAHWRLVAPSQLPVSLDQDRAATEIFIVAHKREDYSPYDTLRAAQATAIGLPADQRADAIWHIALRDALDAATDFGRLPTGATIVPVAQQATLKRAEGNARTDYAPNRLQQASHSAIVAAD